MKPSYVERYLGARNRFMPRGAEVVAYGRVGLKKAMEGRYAGGHLAGEHALRLFPRLNALRKEFDGLQVEAGLYRRRDLRRTGSPVSWSWPYAAIWLDAKGAPPPGAPTAPTYLSRPRFGVVLVPCASACHRIMTIRLPMADGSKRKIVMPNVFNDLVAVPELPTGSGDVTLSPEQLSPPDAVRPGDAWLLDFGNPQRVRSAGSNLGWACQYGPLEEMLDAVRCRLVFDLLPSA
jgi:hypothetical protein